MGAGPTFLQSDLYARDNRGLIPVTAVRMTAHLRASFGASLILQGFL